MDDDFMNLIPPHRTYIDQLIDKEVIEHYAVSMESQQVWITLKAENKKAIEKLLSDRKITNMLVVVNFGFWKWEIGKFV